MEQKNFRWSSKRFYFFMMAFTLNLILPKKTMDFLNGVQPIFPENWFGVFSKLDFGDFLCLQYFQQWTVQNLLIFSIVLFLLSLLPKAEPLSEKAWKVWTIIFVIAAVVIGGFGLYMILGVYWLFPDNKLYMFFYELYQYRENIVTAIWVMEAVLFDRILQGRQSC